MSLRGALMEHLGFDALTPAQAGSQKQFFFAKR